MGWEIVKAVVWLVVLLGAAIGALWLVRRAMAAGQRAQPGRIPIDVCGQASILPKKSVAVVRVAGRYLVVGVSDASISLLAEIEAPAAPDTDAPDARPLRFTDALRSALTRH